MAKVINEEMVQGLVAAITENKVQVGDNQPSVKVRYMGDMYMRGPVFRVEGTSKEGTANEIEEAAVRTGCTLEILKRQEDRVVQQAQAPVKK